MNAATTMTNDAPAITTRNPFALTYARIEAQWNQEERSDQSPLLRRPLALID